MPFSAQAFADYFKSKIDVIRAYICGVAPPVVNTWQPQPFSNFGPFSVEAVIKAINIAANKQHQLDPAPAWLVKQCSDILAPALTGIINSSFRQACFPDMYKTAAVKPLLKKSNMDPFDLKSYRPISNMPLIS